MNDEAWRLCGLAGQRLKQSPFVNSDDLSWRVKNEKEDWCCWLYFLMDIKEGTRMESAGIEDGKRDDYYLYHIKNLVQASLNGCLECIRRESAYAAFDVNAGSASSTIS